MIIRVMIFQSKVKRKNKKNWQSRINPRNQKKTKSEMNIDLSSVDDGGGDRQRRPAVRY